MSSFRRPVQVIRRAAGQWVGGRWVEGPDGPADTIMASVQPATLSDDDTLQALPEGRRVEAMVRVYTDAVLTVAGADNTNGDRVVWPHGPRPGHYLVRAVSPWQSGVISHYRYLAVLEVEP